RRHTRFSRDWSSDVCSSDLARRAITRHMKRAGRVWIRIFPDVPVTKKPAEVRMGSGKGAIELWASRVKPGRIMFELDGVSDEIRSEERRVGKESTDRWAQGH